ncbi:MAG: choice-of-anchor tandem repeat GloVer-containing protein [Terriglobales bacterium]
MYGTTSSGGVGGRGTVYQLTASEFFYNVWAISVLHSFSGPDGASPGAGVILDAAGNVYGTTQYGGPANAGTVFELTPPVKKKWTQTVMYNFTGGADGSVPTGSLVFDNAGNLYGTTNAGGAYGQGVVYEVTPAAATTTTLTSSPNPSTHDQAVTFTAVVASSAGAPPDGETVSFMKGTKVLGTGPLSGGSASLIISTLPVGTNSITAAYGGDPQFAGSTSNVVKQVVEEATK